MGKDDGEGNSKEEINEEDGGDEWRRWRTWVRKAEEGISEQREEEVEVLNPCLNPDSWHTGAMLGMLVRSRVVLIVGVLDSVTPKIWRDEPLLRILAEREVGRILSLRHPYPDRAILSFIRTWCFEEEYGSFITRYGKRILMWGITIGLSER